MSSCLYARFLSSSPFFLNTAPSFKMGGPRQNSGNVPTETTSPPEAASTTPAKPPALLKSQLEPLEPLPEEVATPRGEPYQDPASTTTAPPDLHHPPSFPPQLDQVSPLPLDLRLPALYQKSRKIPRRNKRHPRRYQTTPRRRPIKPSQRPTTTTAPEPKLQHRSDRFP